MADEVRDQDEADKEQSDFMKSMKPWTDKDMQSVLAWYEDFGPRKEGERIGARVMFDPKSRRIILEIKVGEKLMTVTQSLRVFVQKVTNVAIEDVWQDCGLLLP